MYENTYEKIAKAQSGDEEAMASLVKNNLGLVYNIAKRFSGRGYELEDLNQIGALGLIKSIKKFDTSFDVQLSTYSVPFIMGEIKRYIRDDGKIKVSRSIKELGAKINQIQKEYYLKNGQDIKIEQIAEVLKVPKEDIALAIDANSSAIVTSINEPVYSKDSSKTLNVEDIIPDTKNQEAMINDKLTVNKLIEELQPQEKQIVMMRYYKGSTQTEVAKTLGISQVQVSRIEKRILYSMKQKLQADTA
ncbi:MAG: SigB/SigF/SigG family RNA polymerase sigma factor [Clostridium sp.]|jgi:RNA polymerase sigma-70 factor, sigma-B/F/G subfamily|nr:SigB/SigF/SigG family RNA polymerase sigma factor [Clostridium sp.]